MSSVTCCVYHNGVPCQFRAERASLTWQKLIGAVLEGLARHADAAEVLSREPADALQYQLFRFPEGHDFEPAHLPELRDGDAFVLCDPTRAVTPMWGGAGCYSDDDDSGDGGGGGGGYEDDDDRDGSGGGGGTDADGYGRVGGGVRRTSSPVQRFEVSSKGGVGRARPRPRPLSVGSRSGSSTAGSPQPLGGARGGGGSGGGGGGGGGAAQAAVALAEEPLSSRAVRLEDESRELQRRVDELLRENKLQAGELARANRRAKASEDNLVGLAGTLAELEESLARAEAQKQLKRQQRRQQHQQQTGEGEPPQQPGRVPVAALESGVEVFEEFEVELDKGEDGLGVYFGANEITGACVVDRKCPFYKRKGDGGPCPAEACGMIRGGDVLRGVNGTPCHNLGIKQVQELLRGCKPGKNRFGFLRRALQAAEPGAKPYGGGGGGGSGGSSRSGSAAPTPVSSPPTPGGRRLLGHPGSAAAATATAVSGLGAAATAKDAILRWATNVSATQLQELEHESEVLQERLRDQAAALELGARARAEVTAQLARERQVLRKSRLESEALAQQVLALQAENLHLHGKMRAASQMMHQTVVEF
jgi:hypothetical protein